MGEAADNIKKLRMEAGMTQEDLAGRLNVTRQTVSSWETGRTEPDIKALEALASELGCSAGELIGDEAPEDSGPKKKKHRQRAVIFGGTAVALILIMAAAKPLLRPELLAYKLWAIWLYSAILQPFPYIFGALCVMYALSAFTGFSIRNKGIRIALLALGILIGAVLVYVKFFGGIWTLLPVLIRPFGTILLSFLAGYYQILYALPVCLIYLGAVKPETKTET